MRLIDADVVVTALVYDDEHGEHFIRHMTIADYLDAYTDEGCPPTEPYVSEDHGCEFCYYECFDSRAYPCSMCVRGEARTDMFRAKMKRGSER